MATGDKHYLVLANKKSMVYNSTIDYAEGSVVLNETEGTFFKANADIAAGTVWEEGDTGATWLPVGGAEVDPYDTAKTDYKKDDLVLKGGVVYRCVVDDFNATTDDFNLRPGQANGGNDGFSDVTPTGTPWVLVQGGFINGNEFDYVESYASEIDATDPANPVEVPTLTNGNKTITFKTIRPLVNDQMILGTPEKALRGISAQYINLCSDTVIRGNLDADSSNLGLFSESGIELRLGVVNNRTYMRMYELDPDEQTGEVEFKMPVVMDNHMPLILQDSDGSGQESWGVKTLSSNHLGFLYQTSGGRDYDNATRWVEMTDQPALVLHHDDDTDTPRSAWMSIASDGDLVFNGNNNGHMYFGKGGTWKFSFEMNTNDSRFIPNTSTSQNDDNVWENSNTCYIGDASSRWNDVYSLSSSNNAPSDERYKSDIKDIPDALLDVWFDYVSFKQYTLDIDSTGRTRVGVIAQDVIKAFEAAGLDFTDYNVIKEEENGYLSAMYDEIQIIEAAAIRRKLGL